MQQSKTPRILLVDDDAEHNVAMLKVLERAGYSVESAADGHEALSKLRSQSFDLVVTDLSMPRMSGLDLIRSVRKMDSHVGVIVVTAFGEWASYTEAMNVGAVDYISKPLRRQDMLSAIGKALARKEIGVPEAPHSDQEVK